MRAFLLISLSSVLLGLGCGGNNVPSCLLMTPEHTTQDGVAQAGQTIQGDRVEDVVIFGTTAIDAAPTAGLTMLYETSCADEACTPDIECDPSTLAAGDSITCDVVDDLVAACLWSCQISITATVLDNDVCRDALVVADVAGEHVDAVPGR